MALSLAAAPVALSRPRLTACRFLWPVGLQSFVARGAATKQNRKFFRKPPSRYEHVVKWAPKLRAKDKTGTLVADVTYSASQKLLLLGEGNFTFAAAVGERLDDCSQMIATSFEPREELLQRYGSRDLTARIEGLEAKLCGIYHGVAAKDLPERFREGSFDCVVFNFPLAPLGPECGGADSQAPPAMAEDLEEERGEEARKLAHGNRVRQSFQNLTILLEEFFLAAEKVLRTGGECHVRLTDQYSTARGLRSAHRAGLRFVSRIDFHEAFESVYKPLGYRPSTVGIGKKSSRRAGTFDPRHSSTFVFRKGRTGPMLDELPNRTRMRKELMGELQEKSKDEE
eukprot:TRINITY_DN45535_c0_g1_i1.p1 TRINITY_DN45535_c0_g1~~TRINITY_DN45535_c0_g1_i1.p1  ORF type:complete len:341 (-),score=97.57 TRINITY_DN45535_c0_g1_i1:274-1296(-)